MTTESPSPAEIREMSRKQTREEFPSGWMEVTRDETQILVIDALLEAPAVREFTLEELADQAGTTPERLNSRIDPLVELSVVESVERDGEVQYTLNADSPIVDQLYELNVAVQRARDGDGETTSDSEFSEESLER